MLTYRVQKTKATQAALRRSRAGARAGVGSISTPIIILDEDSDGSEDRMSDVEFSVELGERHSATATPTPTPTPIRGGTFRFRGLALGVIGRLYPNARFEIHRIGFPKESDLSPKGRDLVAMNALIDTVAIYRVTMTECDVPTEPEAPVIWSKKYEAPGSLDVDEYHNILKLGEHGIGKMSLFTYFDHERNASWGFIRQITGRDYSLEACFNKLGVPDELRRQMEGFGPMYWKTGHRTPHLYICKDMEVKTILGKIKNIMLSNPIVRK